ncbi:sodium-independent anion transporter [Halolactibacillus miurensis]|uniref:Sodium-independent anion transporter n=1 Tax=Halolactibacillus miurensis TaxID=306541 RepID=A0A1I6UNX4_9BACI|nr:SulP family inorganic anion transporter [Halolactibacillus miurensis]GEM05398.1 sodium-independent anion transporter [Halolactibacillus miurensis]SFT03152.1 sulfate permease, SulP family [Halolactibacillus miurensis]
MLKPKLFSILKHRKTELTKEQVMKDIIAGMVVAIIALPLSVALAIASGVTPEKGLITAIIAGFIISFLGGSRVQIGGPTGAFVIIVFGIIADYGLEGLTIATIMAGLFMILFGLIRLGGVIQYIPYPIVTGFTSGIAVVLFSTQVKDFLGLEITEVPSDFFGKWGAYISQIDTVDLTTLVVGGLSLLIIVLWSKVTKKIPGSLIALIVSTAFVHFFDLPVKTIGTEFGDISRRITFVDFSSFDLSLTTITALLRPALMIAFLASIESLLSAVVADGMIGKKHQSNMELIAQGIANIGSALFGGIPATGAIARTAANINNGGRTPIAGMVHALVLLVMMLVLMPLAKLIPMTTLAAILVVVSYNMSEWRSFKAIISSTKSDALVLLLTFSMTVMFDLIIAIEIGMILAMVLFVKRMIESTDFQLITHQYFEEQADESFGEDMPTVMNKNTVVYEITGPLFFGVAQAFLDVLNELHTDTKTLILKLTHVPHMDATAYQSLVSIKKRCEEEGMTLLLAEVKEQPLALLEIKQFCQDASVVIFPTVQAAIDHRAF